MLLSVRGHVAPIHAMYQHCPHLDPSQVMDAAAVCLPVCQGHDVAIPRNAAGQRLAAIHHCDEALLTGNTQHLTAALMLLLGHGWRAMASEHVA